MLQKFPLMQYLIVPERATRATDMSLNQPPGPGGFKVMENIWWLCTGRLCTQKALKIRKR
jgi:hypothetical protein